MRALVSGVTCWCMDDKQPSNDKLTYTVFHTSYRAGINASSEHVLQYSWGFLKYILRVIKPVYMMRIYNKQTASDNNTNIFQQELIGILQFHVHTRDQNLSDKYSICINTKEKNFILAQLLIPNYQYKF